MGLLGSNFVKAMLKRGEQVQVWNRTASKAKALEADGAIAFDNVADAVKGAAMVHITLRDDATVNDVLEQAKQGLEPGCVIIDHTTTSAQGAAERTELWKSRGYTYVHAPVFMGPVNALESTGYMLVSGDAAVVARVSPELKKMTGELLDFGTDSNKAAGIKLLGNLFLIAMTAGVADMLALARALNISTEEILKLLSSWNPGAALPGRLKRVATGNYDQPSWELEMARKDAGLMMSGAAQGRMRLFAIPPIAEEMDKWIAKGYGKHDWTVIGKDAVS